MSYLSVIKDDNEGQQRRQSHLSLTAILWTDKNGRCKGVAVWGAGVGM